MTAVDRIGKGKRRWRWSVVSAFILGGILGGLGGVGVASYQYFRHVFGDVAKRDSSILMERVEVLSRLRLAESEEAIRLLEVPLDIQILSVASAASPSGINLDSLAPQGLQLKALQIAKAYRTIYPSASNTEPPVKDVLQRIPAMQRVDKNNCNSGICRLIEREEGNVD
jgi:hypothetical protein